MTTRRFTSNKVKLKQGEYQRSNGTFEYKWRDELGNRHSIYAKTLPELREKEDNMFTDVLDDLGLCRQDATVNDYFELWKSIKTGIRETTLASYVKFYERYIKKEFGNTKLKNITYSNVVLFFKKLAVGKKLSYSTLRKIAVPLSMVLDLAVRDEIIRNNPCKSALKGLDRECVSKIKDVRALTLKEQKTFEDFLAKPGRFHQYYPIFTVMLWTGMRVGEVIGLRWEDIDFKNNEISVNHTLMYYDKGSGRGGAFKINPPKTRSSKRTIPMLPKVREAFMAEKEHQELAQIKCESVIDGYTNFIFLNTKGRVFSHSKLNHRLEEICEAINKSIDKDDPSAEAFPHVHNHMLRHTFATRMREAGADMKATSEMMGHEGILITLTTYTDASREFKSREINLLQDYCDKAM